MDQRNERTTDAMQSPPPPPPLDPRPGPAQRTVLIGLFVLGVALALAGWLLEMPYGQLVERAGFFYATYAVLVAAAWLPPSVLSRRVDRALERWVGSAAGGYYGMMALATFLCLEWHALLDAIAEFELAQFEASDLARDLVRDWLVGFSLDSLRNFISAFVWFQPAFQRGNWLPGLAFVGATLGVFLACRRVIPPAALDRIHRVRPPRAAR